MEPDAYYIFRVEGWCDSGFSLYPASELPCSMFYTEKEAHTNIQAYGETGQDYVILPAFTCYRHEEDE